MAIEHKGKDHLLVNLVTRSLELSLIQLGSHHALPKAMLERANFYHSFDPYLETMVLGLKTYIHGMERERIHVKYPQDWWQAFKERWFPKWALRRWPVEYVIRDDILYSKVCPHMETMPPRNTGDKVHIEWFLGLGDDDTMKKEKDPYYGVFRNADGSPSCQICGTRLVGTVGKRCPKCEPQKETQ